MTFLNFNFILA